MIVYKITNTLNQKIYIGCTTKSLTSRWRRHCLKNNNKTLMGRAIIKYGKENFLVEELEQCKNKEEMFNKEIYWIQCYNSNNSEKGYNMTKGGDSGPIYYGEDNFNFGKKKPHLVELNKSRKNIKLTQEHKNKLKSFLGKNHTQCTKNTMSIKKKENWKNGLYEGIHKKSSETKTNSHQKNSKYIICLNNDIIYNSYAHAARELNISQNLIRLVVIGYLKQTGGYTFKIIN